MQGYMILLIVGEIGSKAAGGVYTASMDGKGMRGA